MLPKGAEKENRISMNVPTTTEETADAAQTPAQEAPAKAKKAKDESAAGKRARAKASAKAMTPAPKAKAAKKNAAKAAKTAKEAKGKQAAAPKSKTPQTGSKSAAILAMIGRAKGATLAEIMKATDWQAHSVRGWISTAAAKHNVDILSEKNAAGERCYRIKG